MPRKSSNLVGERFGRLIVSKLNDRKTFPSGQKTNIWECVCDCGQTLLVQQSNLTVRGGHTQSCGCLLVDINTTHGHHDCVEYKVYYAMLSRCTDESNSAYPNYGGRGIKVEWNSFEDFYSEMGPRPSDKHTVERIDVNSNYGKTNCIWTNDRGMQSYNQRMRVHNTTGKTGVSWLEKEGVWKAFIGYKNKNIYLGVYTLFEDAVIAREAAEIKYYGFTKE